MADNVLVQPGSPPWQPTEDSELVAVYHRYNGPLTGVIRQRGHLYLFHCVLGHEQPTNFWLYTLIEEADVAVLEDEEQLFDPALRAVLTYRPLVAAFASEEGGITFSAAVGPQSAAPLPDNPEGLEALGEVFATVREQYEAWHAATEAGVGDIQQDLRDLIRN
jgi:hypothetical protein